VLIVTNFAKFPELWTSTSGTTGRTVFARSASDFLKFRHDTHSLFLINGSARLALELALRQSLPFAARRPIIAVDMILRRPHTIRAILSVVAKRAVFRRVDYFLHYFKDLRGLDSLYGISPSRSGFVDFKANLWDRRVDGARPNGEYVLCFGRSLRDFDTFLDAIQSAGCPGGIVDPRSASVWQHGSRFTRPLNALPPNVRILDHDQTNSSQAALLAAAKIVVVPMLKGRLVSPISTILNAMILGKCVVATAGPGVTDIFTQEVLSVPPEDPSQLASVIKKAWGDDDLRRRTAQAGWEYAHRCGSEQDFYGRLIDAVVEWTSASQLSRPAPVGASASELAE
jgi:glycosyltransferase involved in cell wall biosynthesis